ncbi:MAG TPA: class I SAM-dependent methyltransferase [Terriglobales bacterium]|nr:class I SAM-dependent methyltransferase [Terriglobales bacterium]
MDLASWGVTASDQVTGLDIDAERLALAKVRFPNRTYQQGTGECLPFKEENFDRVISTVALPYMNIQKTLAEIHRVLVPGGDVMANGLLFHCTGRSVGFLKGGRNRFRRSEE